MININAIGSENHQPAGFRGFKALAGSVGLTGADQLPSKLREIPGRFKVALRGASADDLTRRPADAQWSAIEVLGHMVDKMTIWRDRLQKIVNDDCPTIPGYDQDALVRDHRYQEAEPELLLNLLEQACGRFATLVESVPVAALVREGIHSEIGRINARDCITIPLDAAREHLAQMNRALKSSRV